MDTATSEGFRQDPTLKQLDHRLTRQWDLGADRSGAVLTAQEVLVRLRLGSLKIDLDEDFWRISHAAEVLWDSGHVEEAREIAALWRRLVTSICERDGRDPAEPRIWSLILSARGEHRARNFGAAVDYLQFAIADIRTLAGGRDQLIDLLSLGRVDAVTEMYCAALAIAIPAARMRLGQVPVLRAQILDGWIADSLIILGADAPPKLRRVHALVIQTFYAIAELGWTKEREAWLDRLERFDDLVRPANSRGQATKPLRDVARAKFLGDDENAQKRAEDARRFLSFLPRHIEALTLNRWWPLPPPSAK